MDYINRFREIIDDEDCSLNKEGLHLKVLVNYEELSSYCQKAKERKRWGASCNYDDFMATLNKKYDEAILWLDGRSIPEMCEKWCNAHIIYKSKMKELEAEYMSANSDDVITMFGNLHIN